MIEVQASIEIDRVPHEVFDFLADMSNNSRWQLGIRQCVPTTEPPVGPGSLFSQEHSVVGQRLTTEMEVIEFEPDYRIRIKSVDAIMPVDIIREVSRRADGHSKVRATVRAEPGGWFLVFAFAARWGLRGRLGADCRRLKKELER
ncbi:MAG: hypothetical protein ACI8TP_002340 [Acidimicrobiales bacterium]|jgi:uncharacterized protein YndB with AHSA1/START domain